MSGTKPRGRFVWYDLLTTDPKSATNFYTKLIGWSTTQWEGGAFPYTMWTNGEDTIGGIMELPDEVKAAGAPPHWLAYVAVLDVDATVKQATQLGAKVLKEATDIPTVGRFAVLADPQGAVIAIFTPEGEAPGHEGPPKKGEFSWNELATTDHEAAFDFYNSIFGWEKTEAMDMGEAGIYQMYGRKGTSLGGIFNKTPDMPGPPAWLFYTKVADVHKAAEKVKKMGGKILNGPMEVPGGDFIVQCMDPQGAPFALHSSKQSG